MSEEYVTSGSGWKLKITPNQELLLLNYDACCIYFIYCAKIDKGYIGSASSLHERIKSHFADLALGKHNNKPMQEAFNTHGLAEFTWGIIEFCELIHLEKCEQKWISRYLNTAPHRLFNIQSKVSRRAKEKDIALQIQELARGMTSLRKWAEDTEGCYEIYLKAGDWVSTLYAHLTSNYSKTACERIYLEGCQARRKMAKAIRQKSLEKIGYIQVGYKIIRKEDYQP